jgi:hypothetical protein
LSKFWTTGHNCHTFQPHFSTLEIVKRLAQEVWFCDSEMNLETWPKFLEQIVQL